MAQKSKDQLIHCANCGEDYSTTYKKCPFCGARNSAKNPVPPVREQNTQNQSNQYDPNQGGVPDGGTSVPSAAPEDDDDYINDGYVFDGQDVFDDEGGGGGDASMNKGGKRLVTGGSGSGRKGGDVNWSRLITFLCSLVIIVAALVIVFTYVYPKLHGGESSAENSKKPESSAAVTETPAGSEAPEVTDPPATTNPEPTPDTSVEPPKSFTLEASAYTLANNGDSVTMKPVLDPADWEGTIIWTSSDPEMCSVTADGVVTNLNTVQDSIHKVIITGMAGTLKVECTIFCQCKNPVDIPETTDDPNASPDPAASGEPVASATPGGSLTTGTVGHVVNASSGLNVRSGPGTSYDRIASLQNGNEVIIVADGGTDSAGIHWLEITFKNASGQDTKGYVSAEYISAG